MKVKVAFLVVSVAVLLGHGAQSNIALAAMNGADPLICTEIGSMCTCNVVEAGGPDPYVVARFDMFCDWGECNSGWVVDRETECVNFCNGFGGVQEMYSPEECRFTCICLPPIQR
jgi:hypothetical protein